MVQEIRKAGPKKIAIFAILAAIAIVFAYGDNSSDDYASGKTLPRTMLIAAPHTQARAFKP